MPDYLAEYFGKGANRPLIVLCGLAARGIYHLIYRASQASKRHWFAANSVKDSANQLRFVMGASFHKKKVMSSGEYRIFRIVEEQVATHRRGYRVLSQTVPATTRQRYAHKPQEALCTTKGTIAGRCS